MNGYDEVHAVVWCINIMYNRNVGGGYLQGVFRGEQKEYVCVQCGIGMVVGYLQVGYIQYSQVLYVYQK